MQKPLILSLLALVSCFPLLLLGQEKAADNSGIISSGESAKQTDKTAAKLIALNLKARGGIQAMNEMDSLKIIFTRKEAQTDFTETSLIEKPAKIHKTIHRTHLGWDYETISVFNGRLAWEQELKPEKRNPSDIKGLSLKLLIYEGELHGPFYNYTKKGHVFSYRGETDFGGQKVYIIRGNLRYGLEVDFLLDKKSFQVVAYRLPDLFAGKEMLVYRIPLGLRKVNGLWMETGYEFRVSGKSYRRLNVKEMVPNFKTDSTTYDKPQSREIWLKGR